jgi:hypothetical protein
MTTFYRISGRVGHKFNRTVETGYWSHSECKWLFGAMDTSQFNIATKDEAQEMLHQAQDQDVRDVAIEEINYDDE